VCGIAGWFAPAGAPVDPEVLRRMTATLAHRGPDGEGMVTGAGFGLGHRRLSIVDLSGGAQPMQEPGGEITVCFNGEIYNHRSLRRDLEWYGHRFATQSDTEALVHGHRQWGERLPSRLNGMFAYAIWDARTRTGWLARDRFGEKPLYLAHLSDGSLLFASELRALLEHPRIERRMSVPAIATYLTLEYLPWPQSPIVGIEKLEPGTCLRWHDGEVVRSRFAEVGFEPDEDVRSDDEWVEQVREELAQSVKLRMMADVPLGVFLSGGVDSSSIAALMGEAVPPGEIHTFSIAFEDPSFDESGYARAVAEALGTTHHVRSFSEQTLLDLVPKLMAHMDEPFGDPSLLPTHLLALFTREHVKVALGGDGGAPRGVDAGPHLELLARLRRQVVRARCGLRRCVAPHPLARLVRAPQRRRPAADRASRDHPRHPDLRGDGQPLPRLPRWRSPAAAVVRLHPQLPRGGHPDQG
jgi:asparagine synthase (glutamine-hydrolysing)